MLPPLLVLSANRKESRLPFVMSSGEMSTERDGLEMSFSMLANVHCTRCTSVTFCTYSSAEVQKAFSPLVNVYVALGSLSVLKVHLALCISSMKVYTLCTLMPLSMNMEFLNVYFRPLAFIIANICNI